MNKNIKKELARLLKEETEEYMRETHQIELLHTLETFINKYYQEK